MKAQPKIKTVLGNHDLHLIALYLGKTAPKRKDTLDELMAAPDLDELMVWLRGQKLLVYDEELDFCMTHAGIPHIWTLKQARQYARELETMLTSDDAVDFALKMYGNEPARWQNDLVGTDRLRVMTNYFSRMRFISDIGTLELQTKSSSAKPPPGTKAWFDYRSPAMDTTRLLFGHWASLQGVTHNNRAFALDTGCVWGGKLTALRLEDETIHSVSAVD